MAERGQKQKKIQAKPISKKRKFIKDGVFYAELNDFLARELAEDGYAGCEVRVTPTRTEVIIRATRPRQVVGDQGRRVREITALVQKRFKYQKGQIILFAEKIRNKGLSALAQAQAVKFRLLQGLSVRRAAYSVVKFIMDKGAKGCEVVVSGKLRGQRAKAMKFRDGYMIHAGDATNYYVEKAVKHVHLRQGVIGIKVKIMLPHDPTGENGVSRDLPDAIKVHDPDKDEQFDQPYGGSGGGGAAVQPSYMQAPTDVRNIDNPPQNDNPPPQQNINDDQQPQQQNVYDNQPPPQNDNQAGGFNNNQQQFGQPQQQTAGGGFDQQY
mmetsp:Transcript_24476/g.21383  ORF Transcript_24476/g.21383 Transcript_24476/m.21383 type:complete len:324 (-) Transcript_24476:189-1160(-)|eukprot:CAMPEP_0201567390 /NCGR_PEP_ID=MMETSP0190_2-20130828/7892_1 /ASSEMBLY_ACC=CAM_ASM_000263 /TAXON_ID=37353 /ORGANISM="Rosalina sp." /LENGTH=323 /DNA_ID=CAMNT_0047987347 /DNA_START=204 /DNA_END=1175 /DNA_ORIENTATION=-